MILHVDANKAEYLIDKNATQACVRAGYSAKTANTVGPRLLVNVGIKELISKKLTELEDKAGLTAERVMLEVKAIATSNIMPRKLLPVDL